MVLNQLLDHKRAWSILTCIAKDIYKAYHIFMQEHFVSIQQSGYFK